MNAPETTKDAFLDGRLMLRQDRGGYRAGLDAMLLAASVTDGDDLMEAGCGAGAALLAVAMRRPDAKLLGLERDPRAAELAQDNVFANGFGSRVRILCADVFTEAPGVFDGVFVNPPYFAEGEGQAPAAAKRHAYQSEESLDRWIAVLSNRLTGGGALTIIHRADRLAQILSALDGRLGGAAVLPVRPRLGQDAGRVLVQAVKGSRAPLRLLSDLVLHNASGGFTPRADAILRGREPLAWR